jgi:hypothetical protein
MNQSLHIHPIQEPSVDEQVIQQTVTGLRYLAEKFSWDFDAAISDANYIYDTHVDQAWKSTGPDAAELVDELDGLNAMEQYAYMSKGGI